MADIKNYVTTASGKFVIFHLGNDMDFFVGNDDTNGYEEHYKLSEHATKPWFFQPSSWFPFSNNYGSLINNRRKSLMIYSEGYKTKEDALRAAEDWELEEELQSSRNEIQQYFIFGDL